MDRWYAASHDVNAMTGFVYALRCESKLPDGETEARVLNAIATCLLKYPLLRAG